MSRQIKFRVWHKEPKQWMDHCSVIDSEGNVLALHFKQKEDSQFEPIVKIHPPNSVIVQQWTGLLDKNGREIYEGDILKRTYKVMCHKMFNGEILEGCLPGNFSINKDIFSEVKWAGTGFDFGEKIEIGWYENGSFEIIGNIFENPELLNQ